MNGRMYYDVIEVAPTATAEQIKEAYRIMAAVWHPDRFEPGTKQHARAVERMKEINAAYEVLRDPRKREIYDEQLRQERTSSRREEAPRPFSAGEARVIERNRGRYREALSSKAVRSFSEGVGLEDVRRKALADLEYYRVTLASELLARFNNAARR